MEGTQLFLLSFFLFIPPFLFSYHSLELNCTLRGKPPVQWLASCLFTAVKIENGLLHQINETTAFVENAALGHSSLGFPFSSIMCMYTYVKVWAFVCVSLVRVLYG